MGIRLLQIDAFTEVPFRGNPAAVCLLEQPLPEETMQAIAIEMNLSETAFVHREQGGFRLRWFTPGFEVDLCGHATLATAHALWQEGWLAIDEPARFLSRSGELSAKRRDGKIALDFPALPHTTVPHPDGLAEALGVEPLLTAEGGGDLMALLGSEREVRELSPDIRALLRYAPRGVLVTAEAEGGEIDIVSRFFAPAAGIDEDPVTGSAHCLLAPFWSRRLGRSRLRAFQASARGGYLDVTLNGDRVELCGSAVTVLRGELLLDDPGRGTADLGGQPT